jgi:hypothetical protein
MGRTSSPQQSKALSSIAATPRCRTAPSRRNAIEPAVCPGPPVPRTKPVHSPDRVGAHHSRRSWAMNAANTPAPRRPASERPRGPASLAPATTGTISGNRSRLARETATPAAPAAVSSSRPMMAARFTPTAWTCARFPAADPPAEPQHFGPARTNPGGHRRQPSPLSPHP